MFKFLKDIKDLIERVESIEHWKQVYAVNKQDLEPILDKICKHKNWEDLGTASCWRDLRCKDCGKVFSMSCKHGGSIACDQCVKDFIKKARKKK